jgi:hypothetical protein
MGVLTQILAVMLVRPAPLILLVMVIFYLWAYMRHDPARAPMLEL